MLLTDAANELPVPGTAAIATWLLVFFATLLWSGSAPFDRYTWLLEVLPALLALAAMLFTGRRFPLTPLVYWLILLHALILMVGGHYTYARVPAFDTLREWFDWSRNHYDRVGHLAQGFVPAIVVRELLLRTSPLRQGRWLFVLTFACCMAVSAIYELLEWWVALFSGEAAESFLGTQGYVWDTQMDMFLCLLGSLSSLLLLGRVHDRQLIPMGQRVASS